MDFRDLLIEKLALQIEDRMVSGIIRHLQSLEGDVETVWNGICIQVRGCEFGHWFLYEEILDGVIEARVAKIAPHELDALWLQTVDGGDWARKTPGDESIPSNSFDVENYILSVVKGEALDWSNNAIRCYLDE
jgi:hypothetical protein